MSMMCTRGSKGRQFITSRRKELDISQQEMAALLKNRDGKPPDYLLDQIGEILKVSSDVLYFWAKRVPPDLERVKTSMPDG